MKTKTLKFVPPESSEAVRAEENVRVLEPGSFITLNLQMCKNSPKSAWIVQSVDFRSKTVKARRDCGLDKNPPPPKEVAFERIKDVVTQKPEDQLIANLREFSQTEDISFSNIEDIIERGYDNRKLANMRPKNKRLVTQLILAAMLASQNMGVGMHESAEEVMVKEELLTSEQPACNISSIEPGDDTWEAPDSVVLSIAEG